MKLESCRHIFVKSSNTKFHENPSIGKRVFPCGQTDVQTDGRTDIIYEDNSRFSHILANAQNIEILYPSDFGVDSSEPE